MLQNQQTPASVDSKTAEEALKLALRLQAEKGERVSVEELQRTADEAGIDRVYLESALHQVTQKAEAQERALSLQAQEGLRCRSRRISFMLAGVVAAVFVLLMRAEPEALGSRTPIFAFIIAVLFIKAAKGGRFGNHR